MTSMHPLQRSVVHLVKQSPDVFPNERDFLESFLKRTDLDLWDLLAKTSGNDKRQAAVEAGLLAWYTASSTVGPKGTLPPWYSMKPSEYKRALHDAARRLKEVEREIEELMPGLHETSALGLLWPEGGIREKSIESMDDAAIDYWSNGASTAVEKLFSFYEAHPQHHPTITGPNSVFRILGQELDSFEPKRYNKPKRGAAWCRHFICELSLRLKETPALENITREQHCIVLRACLVFYAQWIERNEDAADWSIERIDDSVPR